VSGQRDSFMMRRRARGREMRSRVRGLVVEVRERDVSAMLAMLLVRFRRVGVWVLT
jgi:hypothetical protein